MITNYNAINNVYNHFLPSIRNTRTTEVNSNSKNDLEKIYNRIRKSYKDSPVYLIDNSDEARKSAVEFKENITKFSRMLEDFGQLSNSNITKKYIPYSTNENIAMVNSAGDNSEGIEGFDLSIQALAKPQINIGSSLDSGELSEIKGGRYSITVSANDYRYELPFEIESKESNEGVQNKLAILLNGAGVGVKASLVSSQENNVAMKIESVNTGIPLGKSEVFKFEEAKYLDDIPIGEKANTDLISYLGLNKVTQYPSNSKFKINDDLRSTASNKFVLENNLEITLKGISSETDESTKIGTMLDTKEIKGIITEQISTINEFSEYIKDYAQSRPKAFHLLKDINAVYHQYRSEFTDIGISKQDGEKIEIDDEIMEKHLINSSRKGEFKVLADYIKSLKSVTEEVNIKPMQYSENKIVEYKNFKNHNYPAYITSAYSGYLFNNYC